MKRPRQHEIETEAETLLRKLLPTEWVIRNLPKDYGVDFEVELVDSHVVTGKRLWLQLKGTESCKRIQKRLPLLSFEPHDDGMMTRRLVREIDVPTVSFRHETKNLKYALQCPFPLLLFVGDLQENEMFWLPLRDHLELSIYKPEAGWQDQETATVYLPEWNRLTYESQCGHQGLRWYALEPARMYDFAKIHQWAEELQFWETAVEGLAIGRDDIQFQGHCDDPGVWLTKSRDRSADVFSLVLDLKDTLWDSHPEIGSSARESLKCGIDSARRAMQLIKKGPPFTPEQLGSLVGHVSSARRMLRSMSHHFEHGRFLHVLSEMSANEYAQYRAKTGE